MPKQTQGSVHLVSFHYVISQLSNSTGETAAKHAEIPITAMFNRSKTHGINHTCALMLWVCVTADLLSGREESH